MRIFYFSVICLPLVSLAKLFSVDAGLGLGFHSDKNSSLSNFNFMSVVSSPLYQDMNGMLSYNLSRGDYNQAYLADDDLSLEFRSDFSVHYLKYGLGLGLGVNHRQDYTYGHILNQSYIPIHFKIEINELTLSAYAHYYVHVPALINYDNYFSRLDHKIIPSIAYNHGNFNYIVSYNFAFFKDNFGVRGLSKDKLDFNIVYNFV